MSKDETSPDWISVTSTLPGVWRYLPLLGLSRDTAEKLCNPQKPEYSAPIETPKLAEYLGVAQVYLFPLNTGPGGTFKDVEAAIVIAKALESDLATKKLSWHSTGNTARSYHEYARRAGLSNASFFPMQCLNKWKGCTKYPGSQLIAYDGPFQEVSDVAKTFAKEHGYTHMAPLEWKLEGKAPLAFPVAEFCPHATCIVQTIAGGYGPLGMQQGYERLEERGVINRGQLRRFELFQIDGADTISRLLPLQKDISETDLRLPVNPFEPTLQSTNPLSTFKHVRAFIEKTNSSITSVRVPEVMEYAEILSKTCREHGIDISYEDEKSPFISWAGLVERSRASKLKKSDVVVMLITGSPTRSSETPTPDLILKPKNS